MALFFSQSLRLDVKNCKFICCTLYHLFHHMIHKIETGTVASPSRGGRAEKQTLICGLQFFQVSLGEEDEGSRLWTLRGLTPEGKPTALPEEAKLPKWLSSQNSCPSISPRGRHSWSLEKGGDREHGREKEAEAGRRTSLLRMPPTPTPRPKIRDSDEIIELSTQ